MEDLTGRTIDKYRIIKQLGLGGMAVVYLAKDNLDREVAVKMIRREVFSEQDYDRILKRFTIEARTVAQLHHNNIVEIYAYGEYEGAPYLVMDCIDGGTLKQLIGKPIPWQHAAAMLLPIADALAYAHRHNVIHRDVKPANIMLTKEGKPVLGDFGIAKILERENPEGTLTEMNTGVGTPEYMSPEQCRGEKNIDGRSDEYALGIIFYELCTGEKPFTGPNAAAVMMKQLQEPLPKNWERSANLPVSVVKVIKKALEKDPNKRYADMAEFAAELQKLSSRETTHSGLSRHETQIEAAETVDDVILSADNRNSEKTPSTKGKKNLLFILIGAGAAAALFFGIRSLNHTGPSAKKTPLLQPSATNTPEPVPSDTPGAAVSDPALPTDTASPAPSNTPEPTATLTASPTSTNTAVPTSTHTASPTPTSTFTPVPTDTAIPTPTPTLRPAFGTLWDPDRDAQIRVGNTVEFGIFENKPLRWFVLDIDEQDNMLLLSTVSLKDAAYNETASITTTWEISSLRQWLSTDFSEEAFPENSPQRELLIPAVLENGFGYLDNKTPAGITPETVDSVFLLSVPEYTELLSVITECEKYSGTASPKEYWLRSQGFDNTRGVSAGTALSSASEVTKVKGVRPAIELNRGEFIEYCRSSIPSAAKNFGHIWDPLSDEQPLPGDTIELGGYNGEPLRWLVLSNDQNGISGRLFLFCEQIIKQDRFNSAASITTSWESSDIRGWLNQDFLTQAFPESMIEKNIPLEIMPEPPTPDRVFLLSEAEYNTYRTVIEGFDAFGAKEQKLTDKYENSEFWLRSRGTDSTRGVHTGLLANITDYTQSRITLVTGSEVTRIKGIRPAILADEQTLREYAAQR